MFITFEGPEGSGKTTQIRMLAEWLRARGHVVELTREPGGTDIGNQIRDVLHSPRNSDMDATAEILLYSADRAQHVAQCIRPALAAGKVIVSDRYYDSTLAYQGYGRGLDMGMLRTITTFATGGLEPDLTLYLDIDPGAGLRRRQMGGEEWNRLDAETLEFHQRVRAGYLDLIEAGQHRWVVIDAARSIGDVWEEIKGQVQTRLNQCVRHG